ncbi:MAG: S41 family peptidase [Bacteroidota bacterium]
MLQKLFTTLGFIFFIQIVVIAQIEDKQVTTEEKESTITQLAQLLRNRYLSAEEGARLSEMLLDNMKKGKYIPFSSAIKFANQLTLDMRAIVQDNHLKISYDPPYLKRLGKLIQGANKKKPNDEIIRQLQLEQFRNFRMPTVQRLNGNIGYLKIDFFLPTENNKGFEEKMAIAFDFIADSDALIIDLRENPGGYASGSNLFISYFFPPQTHFMTSSGRIEGKYMERKSFTLKKVNGKKYLDKPVYILTSSRTGSAAESIAHIIKHSARGKIIGEASYGAGYMGDDYNLDHQYHVLVSYASGKHPNAKRNWEATGVIPDIKIAADQAFTKAHFIAIKDLLTEFQNNDLISDFRKKRLQWELSRLELLPEKRKLSLQEQNAFVGTYGDKKILQEENNLFIEIIVNLKPLKYKLIALANDQFLIQGRESYRLSFARNNKGEVTSLKYYSVNKTSTSIKQ